MNEYKEPTDTEPIEGIKVWLFLGYPSNIVKLHFQDEIRMVPPFPQAPPQWITFLSSAHKKYCWT